MADAQADACWNLENGRCQWIDEKGDFVNESPVSVVEFVFDGDGILFNEIKKRELSIIRIESTDADDLWMAIDSPVDESFGHNGACVTGMTYDEAALKLINKLDNADN